MARAVLVLSFALALLPGAWLTAESLRLAIGAHTPIAFWDQWGTVAEFAYARDQGLSWGLIFAQSNEHRILFPRLIMFADMEFLRGRNLLPYAGIIASQAALFGLFAVVAWREENRRAAVLALGVVAALVFSLGQWENLTWAFQVQFLMVAAAGAWSIYLYCLAFAARERIAWFAWAGSVVVLVVAAFSMANGMIAGAAAVGVGLLARFRWQAVAGHALIVALIAALYLHGYKATPGHGAVAEPLTYLTFAASYVGNPARAWGVGPTVILGAAGLALSAAAAVRILLGRDRRAGRIALAGVMAFVIGSAVVTAAGRAELGPAQAVVSRYLTFGLMFWAAQAVYWASLVPVRRPAALLALAAVLAAACYPIFVLHARSQPDMAARHDQIQRGIRALLDGSEDPVALGGLTWNVPAMIENVPFLKREQLSIFVTAPAHRTGDVFDPNSVVAGGCLGSLDTMSAASGGWRATGWAWDVAARRPVETVVVVDEARRIVAIGVGGALRPDVPAAVAQVDSDRTGWTASSGPNEPPTGSFVVLGLLARGGTCDVGHARWPQ